MNDIVKGILLIRNSILYSFIISIVLLIFQFTGVLLNNLLVVILVLIVSLVALVFAIVLMVKLVQGIRLLRRVNLIPKLNQRLDETVQYFFGLIATAFVGVSIIFAGFFLQSFAVIVIGTIVTYGASVFSWLVMLRLIQVNGILGVYANNNALKDEALSVKSLFYFQIGNSILFSLTMIFKSHLGLWYLAIIIPSWLFSLYFLFMFIGLLNQTIKVYSRG